MFYKVLSTVEINNKLVESIFRIAYSCLHVDYLKLHALVTKK